MNKNARIGLIAGVAAAVLLAVILYFTLSGDKTPEESVVVVEEEIITATPSLPSDAPAPEPAAPAAPAEPAAPAPTAEPQPKPPVQPQYVVEENETITLDFIKDLAAYVVEKYQPKGGATSPDKARAGVTFKGVNTRYGLDPKGIEVQRGDLKTAREEIFNYVFSQAVISTLFDLYAQEFVDTLVDQAGRTQKTFVGSGGKKTQRTLDQPQIATMLRLDAAKLSAVAEALDAMARLPELTELMGRYFAADARVEKTNLAFQSTLNRLQPEAQQTKTPTQAQRLELQAASSDLKSAIVAREKIKQRVLDKVASACTQGCQNDPELFYMAKWTYRRLKDNPQRDRAIISLAEAFTRLAHMMRTKAESL